jgi:hypothetical protein
MKLRTGWLVAASLVLCFACDDGETPSVAQDTGGSWNNGQGADVSGGDIRTGADDASSQGFDTSSTPDMAVDQGSAEDMSSTDVDRADVGTTDIGTDMSVDLCTQRTTEWETARAAAASGCTRASECGTEYNTLCPTGGCYTHFKLGDDLSKVTAAAAAYKADSCDGGQTCRCAAPPEALACTDGQCEACPSTCEYTCAMNCTCYKDACGCDQPFCVDTDDKCTTLKTKMQEAAEDARTCVQDSDCVVSGSPICPEIGCHLAHNRFAAKGELNNLVSAYVAAGCHTAVCSCTPPPNKAVCNAGTCEGSN